VLLVALVALVACEHQVASTPTELRPGHASLAVRGTLQVAFNRAFHPRPVDLAFDGVACERLGWVNFYAAPPRHVIAFDPGVRALAVGDYAMGSSESAPRAWLNMTREPSIMTLRGTTRLTSVTPNEVAGVVDWVIAVPNDTARGLLTVRGAFRALRMGDACMPHPFTAHVLGAIDFALGIAAVLAAAGLIAVIAIPAMHRWDRVGFSVVDATLLLPYGLLAMAAGHAMRSDDRGRWLLQTLTLLPIVVCVALLLRRRASELHHDRAR